MIALTEKAEGVVIAVRAQPGARRNEIVGEHNGALKTAVTAPADQGKANRAILELLAGFFGLKKSQVTLLSGQSSRDKKVLLAGLDRAAAEAALRQIRPHDRQTPR